MNNARNHGFGVRASAAWGSSLALVAVLLVGTPAHANDKPTPPAWPEAVQGAGAAELKRSNDGGESAPIITATTPTGDYSTDTDGSAAPTLVSVGDSQASVIDGAWHNLGDTGIAVASGGDPVKADAARKQFSKAKAKGPKKQKATAKSRVDRVEANFIDADEARRLGLAGPALTLKRADGSNSTGTIGVRIPREVLDSAFGADYATRANWVQVDAKHKISSRRDLLANAKPVASSAADEIVVAPRIASAPVMLVALAAPASASGTGDFTATSLKPSSAWDVSAQTGTFSWQYPLRVPPAPAGPSPDLSLSYDSQSVDGLTGSTNNQPSAIGEGWSLAGSGFIERSYTACAIDDGASGPVTTSGDLCFKDANATISFAGHSGELVPVTGTNQYRLGNDDGTRFTEFKGAPCAANGTADTACWQMITTDGTQYFFGLNQLPGYASGKPTTNSAWTVPVFGNDAGEPCHAATFAASACNLGWRWNLDYVVDVHGTAEAYYYNAQTNQYAKNGATATSYVRGGELEHIEYGLNSANVYTANSAAGKVVFSYDGKGRCTDASGAQCTTQAAAGNATKPTNAASYPDTPYDQTCTSGTCAGLISPTFWTTSKLSSVKTQVLTSATYKDVDSWTLKQSFPAPGDGTSPVLWLDSITHTGYTGTTSLTEPAVTFGGTVMQNRVWAIDGLAPLDKWRIGSIKNELGAITSVNYSAQECTTGDLAAIFAAPEANSKRCYPQWWTPQVSPPMPAKKDLFHKYVVASVVDNPQTGGGRDQSIEKYYSYGTPAWRYNDSPLTPADKRSWSIFAGFDTAEVRVGNKDTPAGQNVTKYTFFRGLDGDRANAAGGAKSVQVDGVTDSRPFAGMVRKQAVTNGVGGALISTTTNTPWATASAGSGLHSSWFTGQSQSVTSQPVSTGGSRTTTVTTSFDPATGLPLTQQTAPSDATGSCTTTTYAAANTAKNVVGLVAETWSTSGSCADAPTAGADRTISGLRTSYDNAAVGAAPILGDATKVEHLTGFSGSNKIWTAQAATIYDAQGRPTQVTDALSRATKTAYTPAGLGGPTTKVVTTNPLNWTTTTDLDPAWGAVTKSTDVNGKVTTAGYDALGRRTGVWLPNRPIESNATSPSTKYSYTLSQTAASTVTTETAIPAGTKKVFDLYDGLGRMVQHQAPAVGSGGVMTDTGYDSQGRVVSTTLPYWATAAPSSTQFVPSSIAQIPSRTDTVYDATGRTTATVAYLYGDEKYRTSYAYPGADRVDLTPPAGGTPTTTITNSLNQKTSLTQYQATTPTGTGLVTTYEFNPQGKMSAMADPVGNRWSWTYDLQGNTLASNDPDSGTTTSTYDLAGNLTSTTDARGQVLAYSYDQLNRKTAKYSGSPTGPLLAKWAFDTAAKGQLDSSTSYTGSSPGAPGLAYTQSIDGYDAIYNPTSTTTKIPTGAPAFAGTSYTITLTYNPTGELQQRTLPAIGGLALERLRTVYDSINNVDSVQGTSVYGVASYSPTSQVAYLGRGTSGNTLATTFGYDPLTGAANQVIDSSSSATLASRLYKRNKAGDVTSIETTGTAGTDKQCFRYDYLHALTEAWTPATAACTDDPTVAGLGGAAQYWTSYTVDAATGNRTSATGHTVAGDTATAYTYPPAGAERPHGVTDVAGNAYGYDAAGNTTSRPGQSLTWDESGKLSTVMVGGVTQSRVYDADGNVLLQWDVQTGAKLFLSETELTIAPGATAASALRTYTVAGKTVAERSTKAGVSGTVLTWLSGDLNNTQDLSMNVANGAVVRRFTDPYGNQRGAASTWASEHRYLNAPFSGMTGLTLLGARAYDAQLGRFISVDPVLATGNPQQNNGFAYAANSPLTNVDPSGKCYEVSSDSLTTKTNCVGSKGSAAGPGAATAANGGAIGGQPKNGSRGMTSSDYGKYRGQLANSVPSSAGTWTDDATAGGKLIIGFILGQTKPQLVFGSDSRIVGAMRKSSIADPGLSSIREAIAGGAHIGDDALNFQGVYNAQDGNYISNFLRDAGTYSSFDQAGEVDQMKAALGSFSYSATVVGIDSQNHTATVVIRGRNDSTIGSALGLIPATRPFLNESVSVRDVTAGRGPMSPVSQSWSYSETIKW